MFRAVSIPTWLSAAVVSLASFLGCSSASHNPKATGSDTSVVLRVDVDSFSEHRFWTVVLHSDGVVLLKTTERGSSFETLHRLHAPAASVARLLSEACSLREALGSRPPRFRPGNPPPDRLSVEWPSVADGPGPPRVVSLYRPLRGEQETPGADPRLEIDRRVSVGRFLASVGMTIRSATVAGPGVATPPAP